MEKIELLPSQLNLWLEIERNKINFLESNETISSWNLAGIASFLWTCCEKFALYGYFTQNDYAKSQMYFYRCGRLMEFSSKKCDVFPPTGLMQLAYTLLSDNSKLVQNFSSLGYTNYLGESYIQWVERGTVTTPVYIVQCLIKDDLKEYERILPIMQDKMLKKKPTLRFDIMFYEGLVERNKGKMEEALAALVEPKIHKKRNTMPIESELISHPALGYAKLAWYKGIEVEVDSPLVPKEWLPIKPLKDEEYVDYDFVKAYLG
jgi:hypothetical protein